MTGNVVLSPSRKDWQITNSRCLLQIRENTSVS